METGIKVVRASVQHQRSEPAFVFVEPSHQSQTVENVHKQKAQSNV